MHSYQGKWVAIGRVVVHYAQDAHSFSAEIKCRHCSLVGDSFYVMSLGAAMRSLSVRGLVHVLVADQICFPTKPTTISHVSRNINILLSYPPLKSIRIITELTEEWSITYW